MTTTRIQFNTSILALEERTAVTAARKQADGTVTTVRESLGWFATIDSHPVTSFFVGWEKPELPLGPCTIIIAPTPPSPPLLKHGPDTLWDEK